MAALTVASPKVRALLDVICSRGTSAKDARRFLLSSLDRVARRKQEGFVPPIATALKEMSTSDDFAWVISAAYWFVRRRDSGLPPGTIFTPPSLANKVVRRLIPGLTVVDLGAGTGMLSLAAAQKGFKVVAIEQDAEMVLVLDQLARILGVRDSIDLRVQNALDYRGAVDQQVMSNPPYTRHHDIPIRDKEILSKLASRLGTPLPLTAGHYAYFMLYAWTAEWSKREVLLLPTNWVDAKYGYRLREVMIKRGPCEILLLGSSDGRPVFANALTTACLITTQSRQRNGTPLNLTPRIQILALHHNGKNHSKSDLFSFAKLKKVFHLNGRGEARPTRTLAEVFRVKRGIATGSNSFFVLPRSSAKEREFERTELKPILRRLSHKTPEDQVQYLWVPGNRPSKASLMRIREGKRLGVHKRYLCANRRPWWRIDIPHPPDFFMTYMGRGNPVIKPNRRGLLNLNNVHGLYLQADVPRTIANRLIAWLRTTRGITNLMTWARRYHGGLWKLEPGDVERLRIPRGLLKTGK